MEKRCLYIRPVRAESEIDQLVSLIAEIRSENPDKNITVIVPESMTLEYEHAILRNRPGMMNVTVKSVRKVQSTVLQTYGYGERFKDKKPLIISKAGNIAKIYIGLNELTEKLRYVKTPRISSAERIYDTIEDLRVHGYTREDLEKFISLPDIPPLLRDLLSDILFFYGDKEGNAEENALTDTDVWDITCEQIKKHGYFSDSYVIFCGFDIIYPRLRRLISCLLLPHDSECVNFVILFPSGSNNGSFDHVCNSIKALRDTLKSTDLPLYTDSCYEKSSIAYDPAIKYLAGQMIGLKEPAPKNYDNITVYNAANQYTECLHAAQQLIDWHNEGRRWNEMGVVIDDENSIINEILPRIMESAGIPHFIAYKKTALVCTPGHYFSRLISCSTDYSLQSMVDLMKSGFSTIPDEEAKMLENFAWANGLKGSKWLKPLNNPHGDPKIAKMDEIRQRFVEPIAELHKKLADRKKSAIEQANAIWEHLEKTGFYARLQEKEKEYRDRGYVHYADQVRQSWHIICNVLNIIATETGEHHLSMDALNEIVAKCLEIETLQSIPQTADAVLVDKSRVFVGGQRKNCVYMGLQEKVIDTKKSLLTPSDRKWLDDNGERINSPMHCMYDGSEGELSNEVYRWWQSLYRGVMSATEKLCVSSSQISHSGQPLQPDELFIAADELVKKHNPQNVKGGILLDDIRPFAHDESIEMIARKLRELVNYGSGDLSDNPLSDHAEEWKELYEYLQKTEPETIRKIMDSMNATAASEDIPPDVAEQLFDRGITSVTELEMFAQCPFSHFIRYGLRPEELRNYGFEVDQKGSFFHAAMKAYIEHAGKDPDFPRIRADIIVRYFNDAVQPLVEELQNTALSENTLSRMELAEYVQTARSTALYVTYWLAETEYKPAGCEVRFGSSGSAMPALDLKLPSGKVMHIMGSIDRYDVYKDPRTNEVYGRIIDYKSGASSCVLDRKAVENGYQLQLPIYLSALLSANPGMRPSGAMYQHICDAVIDDGTDDEDKIMKKVMDKMQMSGMYLDTGDDLLKKASGGSVKEQSKNADGTRKESRQLQAMTVSELEDVLENSKEKAVEHAENILHGKIDIHPVKVVNQDPCKYCSYKNICMFNNNQQNS